MHTSDGPKYNDGQFPIDGGLEKGSEANVTEDGGNNSMRLVGQFWEEDWCVSEEGFEFFNKNESLLQEVLSDNPAAVAQGETVNEEMPNEQSNVVEGIPAPLASTVLGGSISAAQTVRRGRPAPTGVEIKVVTQRSPTDKRTMYIFDVDPNEEVASLRVRLANRRDVPPLYRFYYNREEMQESCSFRAHQIDGVGERHKKNIEVMDVTPNSQLISSINI